MHLKFRHNLLFIVLFLAAFPSLTAQNVLTFEVSQFYADPQDLTASNPQHEKFDPGTGKRFALVKVRSVNPRDNIADYNFAFGMLDHQKIQSAADELWLYVQPGAKRVNISRAGYASLRDFSLGQTLESGKTYVMMLSAEAKRVLNQMIRFNVSPADSKATIMVQLRGGNEEKLGEIDATGSLARPLPYGQYDYKIIAENYHTAAGTFTLGGKDVFTENVTLKPNFGNVTIEVDADAEIMVNGMAFGRRRWTGQLKAGEYTVECTMPGHRPSNMFFIVNESEAKTITVPKPTPITGAIALNSKPLGADIYIDGQHYGQTPKMLELLVGEHEVKLLKGDLTDTRTVTIEENNLANINVNLSKKVKIAINSKPSDATLSIGGKKVGQTPYVFEGESGDYDLKLEKSGYLTWKGRQSFTGDNRLVYKLKRIILPSSEFYIAGGVSGSADAHAAANLSVGVHIANINIEAEYMKPLEGSTSLYWNSVTDADPIECDYSASMMMGAKVGYGLKLGRRVRFTPQVGIRFTKISEDCWRSSNTFVNGAYCVSGTAGMRMYLAFGRHIGFSLTPQAAFALSKSEGFKMLSDGSAEINKLTMPVSATAALVLSF